MPDNADNTSEPCTALRPKPQRKPLPWYPLFLRMARLYGTIGKAARAAKVGRRTVQLRLAKDPAFREAYDRACQDARDRRIEAATRRALKGEKDRPPSDRLLCKLIDRDDRLAAAQAPGRVDPRADSSLAVAMAEITALVLGQLGQGPASRRVVQGEVVQAPPAAGPGEQTPGAAPGS